MKMNALNRTSPILMMGLYLLFASNAVVAEPTPRTINFSGQIEVSTCELALPSELTLPVRSKAQLESSAAGLHFRMDITGYKLLRNCSPGEKVGVYAVSFPNQSAPNPTANQVALSTSDMQSGFTISTTAIADDEGDISLALTKDGNVYSYIGFVLPASAEAGTYTGSMSFMFTYY